MSANHRHTGGTALTSTGPGHGAAVGGPEPHASRVARVRRLPRIGRVLNRSVGSGG